jgi:hypothetical protein
MHPDAPESYVDAVTAADFLALKPRRVLELARAGSLPAYPLGLGARRVWRFRLNEIVAALKQIVLSEQPLASIPSTRYRSKPPKRSAGSK